ncbi:unnamed protein product [Cylindrotheca closterium]|uniref:Uncharacterized protein n=1 Tax=Cylindrotheca closterium TaxID=2856 RepID=A0AAD2JGD9_9STRA|nr:unnamed protein product [Cylindrotheca closterium]
MSFVRRRSRADITNRRLLQEEEEEDQAQLFYYSGIERVPNDVTVVHLHESMKSLPYQAFYLKKVLRKVQFHDTSLRTICERAFASCSALEEAILPNSIEEIERGAFSHCTSLHTVYLSPRVQLTVIGRGAFSYCKSLVSFQVPPSVHTIERAAFTRCDKLQHVEFVSSVSASAEVPLDESSPSSCDKKEPLLLFESQLQCIDSIAFGGCTGLQTLRLPHGLIQIQSQAFSGCTWLDAIEIPATVEELSSLVFVGCHNLKHVALPPDMDLSEMPDDVFQECHLLNPLVLSVMKGAEQANDDSDRPSQVLQSRFEGLPIHELCYYSQDQEVLEQLLMLDHDDGNLSEATQDCFGMTPFHILALSGNRQKAVLDLLKLLLKDPRFQTVVTKKDMWGYFPLVYACQVDSPLPVIKLLLEVHQKAAIASTTKMEDMVVDDSAAESPSTNQATNKPITVPWNHLVRHCASNSVKNLRFIVRSCLKDRIQRLGLQQWKTDVTFGIFQIPVDAHPEEARTEHIRALCRQLAGFEEREALAILELAVWKGSLDRAASAQENESAAEKINDQNESEETANDKGEKTDAQGSSDNAFELEEDSPEEILRKTRHSCRVTCNSDVILMHVRQHFKIPPTDFF